MSEHIKLELPGNDKKDDQKGKIFVLLENA